jgi:hypothetical protein
MVVEFPQFQKVTLKDKRLFDTFNAQFTPYADWAFGTLMTWWDIFDNLEASWLHGNIVIKSSYLSMGQEPVFTLLGDQHIDQSLGDIFSYQRADAMPQKVASIPQHTLDALKNPEQYIIEHDAAASEHILSIKKLVQLEGRAFHTMRNALHRFEHATKERTLNISHVNLNSLHAKMLLINALHTWHEIYENDRDRIEGAAIDRALLIAEHIDLESICIFIDKTLVGFTLFKSLPQKYVNLNHIKSTREYPDLFRYLTHVTAVHLQNEGYEFINAEQDLGIEGLRRFKTSLQPVDYFKKYTIRPKN